MKKIVNYTTGNGAKRIGLLIKENKKTAIIQPFRWIAADPIKVHKIKNNVKIKEDVV